ncbi:hypothetical protein A1395_20310 [Pseudomonas protegens]|nr:hypothetical protein A1395_20310 [Pseudomonas protegens]
MLLISQQVAVLGGGVRSIQACAGAGSGSPASPAKDKSAAVGSNTHMAKLQVGEIVLRADSLWMIPIE